MKPTAGRVLGLLSLLFLLLIAVNVVLRFSGASVWDDAFMFVRYADNILTGGTLAFNPGGEATYGLTSLAFLIIVLPLRVVFHGSPALTAVIASTLCGVLFVGALVALLKRFVASRLPHVSALAVVVVLFSLAFAVENFSTHFISGMDTMFALAGLTAYIFAIKHHEETLSVFSAMLAGCIGGLLFSVRPDLVMYAIILPATSLVLTPSRRGKMTAAGILMVTGSIIVLQMFLCARYLGSPVPLSFHAKGLDLYGDFIHQRYRLIPWLEFREYVLSLPVLFASIAMAGIVNPGAWWKKLTPVEKGLLFATIIFSGYYLLFVLQVMGGSERFYYPTLPPLALLAGQSVVSLVEELAPSGFLSRRPGQRLAKAILVVALAALTLQIAPSMRTLASAFANSRERFSFDVVANYRENWSTYWFQLDQFSELPDDLIIATTEVGHPLALNPRKVIVDLAGLNETTITHKGLSSENVLARYRPDLIYMPNPDYPDMIQQIQNSPLVVGHYDFFGPNVVSSVMGVAIKRDSKYYQRLRGIVDAGLRRR